MGWRHLKRTAALLTAGLIVLGGVFVPAAAEEERDTAVTAVEEASASSADYSAYQAASAVKTPGAQEIVLFQGEKGLAAGDSLSLTASVPSDSLYRVTLTYRSIEKKSTQIALAMDGAVPFSEAERIEFPTWWENGTTGRRDNRGNEFSPEQVISAAWITADCRDYTGKYEQPYQLALTAGDHVLALRVTDGAAELQRVVLTPATEPAAYDPAAVSGGDAAEVIPIEGESASLKSSLSLIPLSDDSSPRVSPADPTVSRLNYIGGAHWSSPNDTITWKVNVEKAGYYALGFLYRQSELLGGVSYRRLAVDGAVPFAEAERIKFKYGTSWDYQTFSQGNKPYYLYFTAGEHTLSLSVTAGELNEIHKELEATVSRMGDLYVDITMVVGETVDVSRSYELFNQIPQFNERLEEMITSLESVADRLEKWQEKKSGSNVSVLRNAVETMRKMHDRPYSSHKYKNEFYSAYTTLSSLMSSLTEMPLDIDRIFLIGKSAAFTAPRVSFFERLSFSFRRFWHSFAEDYRAAGENTSGQQPLDIWVSWGRDQAQMLDALIQSDFVTEENIPVNLRLVNASNIQAILSGNGPDIMLQMSHTEPVNLAMRGALLDLRQFDDFEEVTRRFTENGTLSFAYRDGTYALPDTLGFYLMFVRTDILEGLGLSVPRTWQDFIRVATILQHNNLQVALPYTQIASSGTVNVGVGGLTLYPTLLMQNGLELYTADRTGCTLAEEESIRVLTQWTDFYTKYKVPVTLNFYNRFRIGSVPLGISGYATYVELEATAPEIAGRWEVYPLPGVERADGTVDITCAGSGTGCAITKTAKEPEKAWAFLKWWTKAETQLKYSDSLESVLGPLGRVGTANVEALLGMDWSESMRDTLKTQLSAVRQIPEIPGGYYLARGVDQVFWNVVEQNANPTDTALSWGAVVDGEITRKLREYAGR